MKDKFNIHKDSEIWEYVDKVDVTQELVDFFEEERKKSEREKRRFVLNKVIGLTLVEIAEIEKVSSVAILKSIRSVQSKLEKALKFDE